MNNWQGTININQNKVLVSVDFEKPSEFQLGSWQGNGILPVNTALLKDTFETEIGTLVITNQHISTDACHIRFQGTGAPKGELEKAMGIVK